ncbi:MAG: hypothetical protein E7424_01710 [Ruminococcaceae bacterium]|nr:hypothetical protein [Oscillospiraceae bacterium]
MDEREHRKRKERSDLIWTFIIIGGFLAAWPIGLVLAILKGRGVLPEIGMNTPTRQESWRDFKVNPTGSAGQKTGAGQNAGANSATNWSAQAQAQAERTRQQAQYWAEQARVQAERTRQRAVQWAVPIHTQRAQQTNPTPAEQARRAQERAARQQAAQNAAREQAAREAAAAKQAAKQAAKERKKDKLRFGKPMFITGLCIGAVGAVALADELAGVASFADFLRDGFFPFGVLAVGIYLIIHGFLRARQSKRLQEYDAIIKPNGEFYSIHELADRTGRPYRQVLADLQKMVELGVWEQAWIDRKHGRLMFTEYSAEQMVSGGKSETAPEPLGDKRAEEVLKRIRDDNDRIADQVISQKIDRIELLTGEIFRYLSKHPEREGELRTFMDYYLPQTLKILETYAQLEAQGVETDNIRKAKDQISDVLDQLTESYERQLDKLFDTDVLDISADIDVMKKMLQNDGLAADELAMELEKLQ